MRGRRLGGIFLVLAVCLLIVTVPASAVVLDQTSSSGHVYRDDRINTFIPLPIAELGLIGVHSNRSTHQNFAGTSDDSQIMSQSQRSNSAEYTNGQTIHSVDQSDPARETTKNADDGHEGLSPGGHRITSAEAGIVGETGSRFPEIGWPGLIFTSWLSGGGGADHDPGPEKGRGPAPQRQQEGPPFQSARYPCGPAQARSLPPIVGESEEGSKDPSVRKRSRRISLDSTEVASTDLTEVTSTETSPFTLPLSPLSLLLFGGYRRISKKNVLEHSTRNVVYRCIAEQPGIDIIKLSETTGINENTLRYHLTMLVSTGKVVRMTLTGLGRYYLNHGLYNSHEQLAYHHVWSETTSGILRLLFEQPGLNRQQIADALGKAGPSVTRQMDILIQDGLVEKRPIGRSNHYYLTPSTQGFVSRISRSLIMTAQDELPRIPISTE